MSLVVIFTQKTNALVAQFIVVKVVYSRRKSHRMMADNIATRSRSQAFY